MKRIYHKWDKWECYPAGFYEKKFHDDSMSEDDCKQMYATFLRNIPLFELTMECVLASWKNSAEHYLSNESMNRIAWLGQAAMCYLHRMPATYCGGFNLLNDDEKLAANLAALKYLNKWLVSRGEPALTLVEAESKTKANLY